MSNWGQEEVAEIVALMTRKTINDFTFLNNKEKQNEKKHDIKNNLSQEELEDNKILSDRNNLENELEKDGLSKGYLYLDDENNMQIDSEKSKEELKELYKFKLMYEFADENEMINNSKLDIEYLKNEEKYNGIIDLYKSDNFQEELSQKDIDRIQKESIDELYYPNLYEEVQNEISKINELVESENTASKEYVEQKSNDLYFGIYLTDIEYTKEFNVSKKEIDRLNEEYDLQDKFKEIENIKENSTPDMQKIIDNQLDINTKKYEEYTQKYFENKNESDLSAAKSYLATKNLSNAIDKNINSEQYKKDELEKNIKKDTLIKKYQSKDDEKIKRLKQDELYSKLFKQIQKNEKFLNSTQSNIAYKSRSNAEDLTLSSANLNERDNMKSQTRINQTESNVRNTINDTRTDNKIHDNRSNKEKNKDNEQER